MDTPVVAPAEGIVAFVGQLPARGNVLVLDHGAGVFSTYAHLQRFDVQVGAQIKAGQTIARVGTTGFSTGPHLHWELWVDGANVDPVEWTHRAFP
jgi:murein DD-endopeptidase MepM/ murein hydrolase activator NlpD